MSSVIILFAIVISQFAFGQSEERKIDSISQLIHNKNTQRKIDLGQKTELNGDDSFSCCSILTYDKRTN